MANPEFELWRGPGSILLAQPAFLTSVISSFFTQNKGGGGADPLGPSPRSGTASPLKSEMLRVKFMWKIFLCHLGSILEG